MPGKTACLRLREWSAARRRRGAERRKATSGTGSASTPCPTPPLGGSSIELYAYQLSAITGDSFDIDGITLTAP